MAKVTLSLERLSDEYLGKFDVYDQEDKIMQEAAEVFGASRDLTDAVKRHGVSNSEQDFHEVIRSSRHLANEIADCMVALLGLAHKHGLSESALQEGAERVARRARVRGRL